MIESLIDPAGDRMLVRRDPPSRQLGVGLGGRAIIAADTMQDMQPCRTGVVLKCGPSATYTPGTRVAFGNFALMVLEEEKAENDADGDSAIGLLNSSEVLCSFAAPEEELARPLSVDGIAHARAPYGMMLVERSQIPNKRGAILLPHSYVSSIRSREAAVIDVHPILGAEVAHRYLGATVMLHESVGRAIPFGLHKERLLFSISPSQVVAFIRAPVGEVPDSIGHLQALGDRKPINPADLEQDVAWDEGDRSAPR